VSVGAKKGGRKDGARRDRTDAASLATRERHAEWIELRRKGYTYEAIAAQFKVAKSTVHEAISTHLRATVAEPAAELRQLELERLDALLREATERIEQPFSGESGDDKLKAIDVALSIGAQRARLLGLNAPSKILDVTPPREDMWVRVRDWLLNATPELEEMLNQCGWCRSKDTSGKAAS
jgi:hypothetical protein